MTTPGNRGNSRALEAGLGDHRHRGAGTHRDSRRSGDASPVDRDHWGRRGGGGGGRGSPAERRHNSLRHLPDETLLAAEETGFVTKAAQRTQVHSPDWLSGQRLGRHRVTEGLGQNRRLAPEGGHVLGDGVRLVAERGAEQGGAGRGLGALRVRLPPEVGVEILTRRPAHPGCPTSGATFIL